jgi:hypothetical protein
LIAKAGLPRQAAKKIHSASFRDGANAPDPESSQVDFLYVAGFRIAAGEASGVTVQRFFRSLLHHAAGNDWAHKRALSPPKNDPYSLGGRSSHSKSVGGHHAKNVDVTGCGVQPFDRAHCE